MQPSAAPPAVDVKPVPGHPRPVTCLGWNCTGQLLATGSDDRTLRVWQVESISSVRPVMNCPLQTAVEQVCWHPQVPTRLATISRDADVKIWDTRTGKTVMVIPTGASHVNINLAWSPDGVFLAAGTRDDHITIIEPGKGAGAKILKRMKFPMEVNEFAWSANSQYLFLTTLQGSVQINRFSREEGFQKVQTLAAHTSNCFCIKISPNGSRMAVGSADSLVSIWDLSDLSCLLCVPRYDGGTKSLSFTADGNACATAVEDSAKVEIFDTTTGAALREIDFGNLNVNAVAWHPQLNAHSQRSILAIALESKDKTVPSLVPPASTSRREEFLVLASIQLRS